MSACHFCGLDPSAVAELRMTKDPHRNGSRVPTCLDCHEDGLSLDERWESLATHEVHADHRAILATARAEAHRAKATVSSLLLAAHTLETLGDEFDRAIAKGIREYLAEDYPHGLPTRAQQLATSMSADSSAARIAQRFKDMNSRRHPGLIRRFLGAIGISCCVFGAVHMGTDLGARVAADVQRGTLEYCGRC